MDIKKLVETLHPLERAVVPHLKKAKTIAELAKQAGLEFIEAERAVQWLENKGAISRRNIIKELVRLGPLGKESVKEGLPESRLLKSLDKPIGIKDLPKKTGLSTQECNVSMGVLKRRGLITLEKGKVTRTKQGDEALKKPSLEEKFLSTLKQDRDASQLKEEEQLALANLKKRKDLIELVLDKTVAITLTGLGKKLAEIKIDASKVIDRLTPEHLKVGHWKGARFRRYDVTINVPKVSFGRLHHYRSFLDEVRDKFTSLGFVEMKGPMVEQDFWNMDALFMPQFHSARDIHEAYYIKQPQYSKVDAKLIDKVKQVHENGAGTGSRGWRYGFDVKRTQRNLLRTQGTALSARMLSSKGLKIPGKYFGISKCFRYDVIDATHLPDFFQTEGIVVEEGLKISHLKGLLKLFAEEFAQTDQFKVRPAYFPFTEPSCELFAKHPEMGWIELGGAGIFRPELTKTLGVDVPVIAWGMGIGRIGMFKMGIKDIRDLYSQDLGFLKYTKVI